MNILIIPSWYPSAAAPSAGIFFKEQAIALARNHQDVNVGISTWGPNDPRLLLEARSMWTWPQKIWRSMRIKSSKTSLLPNCIEYYQPSLTWTRRWKKGNIENIILSNEHNANQFIDQFGKIDIIHAHTAHPGGFVAMHLAKRLGVPFVVTEHMGPFPLPAFARGHAFDRWMRPVFEQSSTNISVSQSLQKKLSERGISSIVIPNLVDESLFKPSSEASTSEEILAIGRLEPEKGHEYLLKAFQLTKKAKPEARLTIIGTGSLQKPLVRLATQLGIDQDVHWYGEATREEVVAAIQRASFLVLPSLYENLPLALLETIACGKPVVATRCGGPEEIVNKNNGLLVAVGDHQNLSDQMVHMLDHRKEYNDIAIREDFEDRFSSQAVTRQLRGLYEKVTAEYKN